MDQITSALSDGVRVLAEFVPKLLLFLVILVVGLLIAKAIGRGLAVLLEKVGFDRAVERGGIKQALANSSLDASDIVAKVVHYTLMLFVLQLAFGVFGPNPISDLLTQVIAFLPRVIVAIVIIVVAAAIAAGAKTLIEGTLGGLSYGRTIANIASVFILFLGVVAALNQVGVATTVTTPVLITILATIGGIAVVGVGGGLIKPMQHRWEGWLSNAEAELPKIRQQAANAPSATQQVRAAADQHTAGGTYAAQEDTAVAPAYGSDRYVDEGSVDQPFDREHDQRPPY